MNRHFYPVIGTFVGERTLFSKKSVHFGVHFSKIRFSVLVDPLESILLPLLGECAIQVEGLHHSSRVQSTLLGQSDSRSKRPLRAEAAPSRRPLRNFPLGQRRVR